MEEKKVQVINAKDEFELVKKLNELTLNIFASTPLQKIDGSWVMFIYYYENKQNNYKKENTQTSINNYKKSNPIKEKKEYVPTKEQIERWKNMPPTKKTKELLLNQGYSEEEMYYIKSQWDAHVILNNLREENI